jgi:CRISPR-associated protein Csx14
MSNSEPTVRVNVDLTNPGQFFACCGVFELAERLWPGAEVCGAFLATEFGLWTDSRDCTLGQIIDVFVKAGVQKLDDSAASPLHLDEPFNLRLDWWQKLEGPNKTRVDLGGGDHLKTWAGKQCGPSIFCLMKDACKGIDPLKLLDEPKAVYEKNDGKDKKKTTSPFYFDARRDETSLDVGFSADEQDMSVMAYPAVESLALVGLQRFRPAVNGDGSSRSFLYTAWAEPLPLAAAMAAASGLIPVRSYGTFRFTKPSRGGEYLTTFSRATRERSSYD